MEPLFKKGDLVRIVNYGALYYESKLVPMDESICRVFPILTVKDGFRVIDTLPGLVGKVGVVESIITNIAGKNIYSLEGLEKTSWYNEDQLEKY